MELVIPFDSDGWGGAVSGMIRLPADRASLAVVPRVGSCMIFGGGNK